MSPTPYHENMISRYSSDGSVSFEVVFSLHITYPNHPINKIHSCPAIPDLNNPDGTLPHYELLRVLISLDQKNPTVVPDHPLYRKGSLGFGVCDSGARLYSSFSFNIE